MNTLQIITHYADGRPSETRDMTPEEISEMLAEGAFLAHSDNESKQ